MVERLTIDTVERKDCTGCGCCINVCPVQAIVMKQDAEGFYFPHISIQQCISCRSCYIRCPVNIKDLFYKENAAYAAVNKNPARVLKSSSAGIFYELAYLIINRRGFVCGAVFDSKYLVKHILCSSLDDVKRIQGSKYVQSYCADVFPGIKKHLEDGTEVLFSGTPCQVSGLRSYLGKEYPNLYTVDLICHGTPSPGAFQRYLQLMGADTQKLDSILFREKNKNERSSFRITFCQNDGRKYKCNAENDPYYNLFLNNLTMRESCYRCQYAVPDRVSDITLGDCANAGNVLNSAPADAVKSIVVIHTEKGKKLFDAISAQLLSERCNYEEEVRMNKQLHKPSHRPEKRNNTLIDINNAPISQYERNMILPSVKERIKKLIIRNTPAKTRKQMISFVKKGKNK